MKEEGICNLCREKLDKNEGSALYYCLTCLEKQRRGGL